MSYQHDAAGQRTRMDYPGGFFVTYAYDSSSDLTGILENGATTLATYGYDDLGRRTSLKRGDPNNPVAVTTYGYDAVSRLSTLTQDPAGTTYVRIPAMPVQRSGPRRATIPIMPGRCDAVT